MMASEAILDDAEVSNSSNQTNESLKETFGIITSEMIDEEKQIEIETKKEEEELALKEKNKDRENSFESLHKLLNLSKVYANFLLDRIKKQKESKLAKIQSQRPMLKELKHLDNSPSPHTTPNKKTNKTTKRKSSPSEIENVTAKKRKDNSNENIKNNPDEVIPDIPILKQPDLLTGGTLRQYQLEGYEWLKLLYENGINGILADEMGLGKTIQCIALLAHLVKMGIAGPYLIVAPLSTLPNWILEFKRFTPDIPIVMYHSTLDERIALRNKIRKKEDVLGKPIHPIVLTSYGMILRDHKFFRSLDWRYIIIDEGHRIKNYECRLIKELKSFRSSNRLLLTGTPLQNNLAELWSLLNFLLPEIFDDLNVFEAWFDVSNLASNEGDQKIIQQEQEKQIISTMHQILTPFLLRRTKSDVELHLPPKQEILVFAPLSSRQKEFYESTLNKSIKTLFIEEEKNEVNEKGRPKRRCSANNVKYAEIKDSAPFDEDSVEFKEYKYDYKKKEKVKTKHLNLSMQNIMMQLRKVCNHPYLVEQPVNPNGEYIFEVDDMVKCCGKLALLDSMLPALKARGHKVLIFSQMVRMLDILEEYCMARKFSYGRLDGTMNLESRQEQIEAFNDPNGSLFIFLISTRAGGLGVNLTGADTVIIYDSDWNPQIDLQAQDRCHRLGQTRPVLVYRLVTANTIDQKMVDRATAKRKLEKMIIQKGRFANGCLAEKRSTSFSPEELLAVLQSQDHLVVRDTEQKFFLTPEQLEQLMDRSNLSLSNAVNKTGGNGLFKVVSEPTNASLF